MKNDFKGNKQSLPSKPCAVCGRTMSWRKAWAKNWASVLYCSDACRAQKPGKSSAPEADANQGANTTAVATKRTAPRA